ncbi:right-handed parallel beta-helix repeat-containing protein [Paenibacillus mesophilus]|uniref:right-handed parallel beta-helix repeat-containing protein n=1 Tax=Paenibacillus mesophilus TaxID=2582849 RepID=UPI00130535C8|nr:right-handed parallel beta-helix repeat-containing protein [Paenibacillus mesophilus]
MGNNDRKRWKKAAMMAAIAFGGFGMQQWLIAGTAEAETAYYVAPSGDDGSGNGTIGSPFRTPGRARDAVRESIAGGMSSDVTVYMREGVYRLDSSFTLTGADSGRDGHEVVYRSYPGESAGLDASKAITGWVPHSATIYKANVGTSWNFDTLYENSVRAVKARYPNIQANGNAYNRVESSVTGKEKSEFKFYAGDIPAVADKSNMEALIWPGGSKGYEYWYSYTVDLAGIDYADRIAKLASPVPYVIGPGSRYFVQGALELLDQPGEFYLDRAAGMLYYYPRDVSQLNGGVSAPYAGHVVELKGSSEQAPVSGIRLEGLTIRNTDIGKDGVRGENVRNVAITNSRIYNTGDHGVRLLGWAQSNTIEGNEIRDTGYNGVSVEGNGRTSAHISTGNRISGNHVFRVGQLYGNSGGIRIYDSGENVISYNRVHDSPRYAIHLKGQRKGILIGSTIGGVTVTESNYRDFQHARNNIVEFNDVSHSVQDSQDAGVIATWGTGTGSVIRSNRIHDSDIPALTVEANRSFGFGIYLDDNSDDILVQNNVIHGLQQNGGGFLNNTLMLKGIGIRVDNNVMADNRDTNGTAGSTQTGNERASALEFSRNVFYDNSSRLYYINYWDGHKVAYADANTYYKADQIYGFGGTIPAGTYEEWRQLDKGKYDGHSLLADPLFMDAAKGDYRLRYDSPAYRTGFRDIAVESIGLPETFAYADAADPIASVFVKRQGDEGSRSWTRLETGGSAQLGMMVRTATGFAADLSGALIAFTSSNPAAATVDSSGRVTAAGTGVAEIAVSVTKGGKTIIGRYHVLVNDSLASVGVIIPDKVYLGQTVGTIVYGVSALGGYIDLSGYPVQYVSDSPAIASVDTEGRLTGNAAGALHLGVSVATGNGTLGTTAQVEVVEPVDGPGVFDFEDGTTVGWAPVAGTWQVKDDGSGNMAYYNSNAANTARSMNYEKRTDYRMTARIMVDAWGSGTPVRLGFMGRYVDSSNFYYAVYEHSSERFKLFKIANGVVSTLASSGPMATDFIGNYRELIFELNGQSLALYLDEMQVVSAVDASFAEGYPGLYAYNQQIYFDNIVIENLTE